MRQKEKNMTIEADFGVLGDKIFSGKYGVRVFDANINTKEQCEKYNKQMGHYVTLNCSKIFCTSEPARKYLIKHIVEIFKKFLEDVNGTILVVGLGNAFLVADSLGALVIKGLFATHNIPAELREDLGDLCALIPGVSGINGFETFDIVNGVVKSVKPSAVIVIDALTAQNFSRIGCSFQFSDTGISPGAGIGNKNKPINKGALGIPVIAVGVPMMINAKVFGYDSERYIVTPKEIDIYTQNCAKILSRAINEVIHGQNYKNYM